ncbi:TMEM175 family protein [Pseudarthrobacter albicanus]|uniref:TMEM175 family protein n=1 Tax=Pseudarthrobacter albicanus TaxID=2823873 RepID=UPI001FEC5ADB|nr:TMEM175 family protein [Pseudarthrobacter albicanus]
MKAFPMNKNRLEAFSDGVLAIIITIMVLELHVPAEPSWRALLEELPTFFSYLLSFIFVGIYWNNHHHMLHLAGRINGGVLWANLHLLFWLSLFPFTTRWLNAGLEEIPVLVYGLNLLLAAIAFYILKSALIGRQGRNGPLDVAMGRDWKGKGSPILYVLGMGLSLVNPVLGLVVYCGVAAIWLIPDRRVERFLAAAEHDG